MKYYESGWVAASPRQLATRLFAVRIVEIQQRSGRPSYRCQRDDAPAFGAKVLEPTVASRIEQRHDPIRFGIYRGNIGPFEAIALEARKREVILVSLSV